MAALFNSIPFLLGFAVFLIMYAFCPDRWRRYLILLGSVVFVAVNSWKAALFALLFAAANFVLGFCVQRTAFRKLSMGLAVAVNALALVTFILLNVEMLGLSYYLFSFIAYLVDIYRGSVKAEYDPIRFAGFTFFFPKFIQGPITRYQELSEQKPRYRLSNLQQGLEHFFLGFAIKILVADKLNVLWMGKYLDLNRIGYESISTKLAWLGAVDVSLQIFLDWQAYMFMAMGIAGMLGYRIPQNFNYPFIARTVGDYYRRWHMTLTRWFKDYLYIPLGGNRKGLARTLANILLVWAVTALWHSNGVSPKYLIWGLVFAGIVLLDSFWSRRMALQEGDGLSPDKPAAKFLSHLWLLLLVPVTILFFWKPASGFNFICWGMTIGVMIVLERLWKLFVVDRFRVGEKLEKLGIVGRVWKLFVSLLAHVWVVIPICVTWVMFRIRDFDLLKIYLSRLFPAAGASAGMDAMDFARYWNGNVDNGEARLWPYILIGILLCFPQPGMLLKRVRKTKIGSWAVSILLALLFWYAVYTLRISGSDPMGYAAF